MTAVVLIVVLLVVVIVVRRDKDIASQDEITRHRLKDHHHFDETNPE